MADQTNIVIESLKYVGGIMLGIFSTWFYIRRENRQIILKKRVTINRLGFTAGNQDWGDIEVIYDGKPSNNINFIVVEIINDTNRDCDAPIILEFSLAKNCVIYKQKAQYISNGVSKDLLWEQAAFDYFHNVKNRLTHIRAQTPPYNEIPASLQAEIDIVVRNRRFVVEALNRNSKVVVQIMGEHNQYDAIASIDVTADIFKKGIKVVPILDEEAHQKKKKQFVGLTSLIIFFTASYFIFRFSDSILWAVLAMVINTFISYYITFPIYSLIKWIQKEFFG